MVAPLSLPALGRPQHRDAAACALEPAPRAYLMVSPAKALKPLYRLRPGEKRSKLSAGLAVGRSRGRPVPARRASRAVNDLLIRLCDLRAWLGHAARLTLACDMVMVIEY